MLDRIKKIFEMSGKTQTQLSQMLDVTPQYIHKILKQQDNEPSERMILSVLKAFPDINEKWLRTGEGEMILPKSKEEEIAEMTASMFLADDDDFRFRLMRIVAQMSEEELEMLKSIAEKLTEE